MPGCPAGAWIPQIEVSPHQAGEAFVVVNNYRQNDWSAYLYHTMDYGVTWTKIVKDAEVTSFVHCVVQDPVVPGLLFLGADDGLYVSTDLGKQWARFPAKNFPRVPTIDLKIHPTDHSLAIATFGRALWVMDNLMALREIAKNRAVLEKPFALLPIAEATQAQYRSVDGIRFTADAEFKGDNRSGGARLMAYVKPPAKKEADKLQSTPEDKTKPRKKDEAMPKEVKPGEAAIDSSKQKAVEKDKDLLKVYVFNAQGDTLRFISQKLKPGWNSVGWDMREKGIRFPSRNEPAKDADDPAGQYVLPGEYKLTGVYNGMRDSTIVRVRLDPRLEITAEDLAARNKMIMEYYAEAERAQIAFKALQDVRKDVRMIESMLINVPDSTQTNIKDKSKALLKKVGELEKGFMEPEEVKGITSEINLGRYLGTTGSYLNSSLGDPGTNARAMLSQTKIEVDKQVSAVNDFLAEDWPAYTTYVNAMNWPLFKKIQAPR